MNKYLIYFLFFFVASCSFDTRSGIWTENKSILSQKENIQILFEKEEVNHKEFNSDLKISLQDLSENDIYEINLTNNNGINFFNKEIKDISKFKFSKIEEFEFFEPELVLDEDGFVFFDDKGNIIKFNQSSEISWKTNVYNKTERKLKPKITLSNTQDYLVAFDNISKFYALNYVTGEVLWVKSIRNPINSQVKIYDDKIYTVDLNNILRAYSLKDGEELWRYGSGNNFLKSNKRNSIAIFNNIIYFNNSLGDVSAVDSKNGNLLWQIPTQSSRVFENAFSLVSSDLVIGNSEIIFSNNRNEFFSLNLNNGSINWKQNINSVVKPVLYRDLIFTISNDGYFFVIEKNSGNILRITKVLNQKIKKIKKKIPNLLKINSGDNSPVGITVGKDKTFLTTNNGKLIIINTTTGKVISSINIDRNKISKPFVFKDSLFVVKDNSIIKLN